MAQKTRRDSLIQWMLHTNCTDACSSITIPSQRLNRADFAGFVFVDSCWQRLLSTFTDPMLPLWVMH